MRPVVTVAEMQAADAAAPVPEAVLVRRAGTAAAVSALRLMGGAYGRRVVVVAGKGNNGADGRVAGRLLARRGARVTVVAPGEPIGPCDLVVDAAFGTGLRGPYDAPPAPAGAAVLAVDIPSGVNGDTGAAPGRPLRATRTVTFAALKPGLLQGDGPALAGTVEVADIGLDVGAVGAHLVGDADVAALLAPRPPSSHKWASAVAVVAGSPGMEGAAVLAAEGAARAGAGMVRLGVPGGGGGPWPLEAVRLTLAEETWASAVLEVLDRCKALVVGPGLGRAAHTCAEVRRLVARSPVPVVADADALFALGDVPAAREVVAGDRPVVVTPHDGEYARLLGTPPGPDRLAAARGLATALGAVALVKGSLTAVAAPAAHAVEAAAAHAVEAAAPRGPEGAAPVLLAAAGSARLATAGTGDVLSGMIGAFLARGVGPLEAAALAAHVHGRGAGAGRPEGLVAPDLPALVSETLSVLVGPGPAASSTREPTTDG